MRNPSPPHTQASCLIIQQLEGISYAGINVWTDGVGEGGVVTGTCAAFDASFCFAIISLVKFLTPGTGK